MEQKKAKVTARKQEVLAELKSFGSSLYNQLDEGIFPTINMPSRGTDNIAYDPVLRQYILGEKNVGRAPETSAT